jgi:hypothetical protein
MALHEDYFKELTPVSVLLLTSPGQIDPCLTPPDTFRHFEQQ